MGRNQQHASLGSPKIVDKKASVSPLRPLICSASRYLQEKTIKENLNFDPLKTAIGDFAGKPILAVIKQVSKTLETFAWVLA